MFSRFHVLLISFFVGHFDVFASYDCANEGLRHLVREEFAFENQQPLHLPLGISSANFELILSKAKSNPIWAASDGFMLFGSRVENRAYPLKIFDNEIFSDLDLMYFPTDEAAPMLKQESYVGTPFGDGISQLTKLEMSLPRLVDVTICGVSLGHLLETGGLVSPEIEAAIRSEASVRLKGQTDREITKAVFIDVFHEITKVERPSKAFSIVPPASLFHTTAAIFILRNTRKVEKLKTALKHRGYANILVVSD